ncbi:hypothetical protein F5Y17DRAFT_418920 [Xylariaceae sp. FL0594]|nr:hypothetical protein F5Y17DRAFT_418920 [Xylariaceae sp. FL0594]
MLWQAMLIHFNATPRDLLSYGLRLHEECYDAPESILLSRRAAMLLRDIVMHPNWGGRVSRLRYVLQKAAQFSIEGHLAPMPPVQSKREIAAGLPRHPEVMDEVIGYTQYRELLGKGPEQHLFVRTLVRELKERITPRPARNETERHLFLVTIQLLRCVEDVLDDRSSNPWSMSLEGLRDAITKHLRPISGDIRPDTLALRDLKWDHHLSDLRDALVREAMNRAGARTTSTTSPTRTTFLYTIFRRVWTAALSLCSEVNTPIRSWPRSWILRGRICGGQRACGYSEMNTCPWSSPRKKRTREVRILLTSLLPHFILLRRSMRTIISSS